MRVMFLQCVAQDLLEICHVRYGFFQPNDRQEVSFCFHFFSNFILTIIFTFGCASTEKKLVFEFGKTSNSWNLNFYGNSCNTGVYGVALFVWRRVSSWMC